MKARPPRKGVRADPLADRLFHRGGWAFVAELRRIFVCYPALFFWLVDNSKKLLFFLKICEHMFDFFFSKVYNTRMHLKRGTATE